MLAYHPEDVAILRAIRDEPDDAVRRGELAARLGGRGDHDRAEWTLDAAWGGGAVQSLLRRLAQIADANDILAAAAPDPMLTGATLRAEIVRGLPRWVSIDHGQSSALAPIVDRLSALVPSAWVRLCVPAAAIDPAWTSLHAPLPAVSLDLSGIADRRALGVAFRLEGLRELRCTIARDDLLVAVRLARAAPELRVLALQLRGGGPPLELDLTPLAALSRLERLTIVELGGALRAVIGGTWPELRSLRIAGSLSRLPTVALPRLERVDFVADATSDPLVFARAMVLRGASVAAVAALAGRRFESLSLHGGAALESPTGWAAVGAIDVRHVDVRVARLPAEAAEELARIARLSALSLHVDAQDGDIDVEDLGALAALRMTGVRRLGWLPAALRAIHAPDLARTPDGEALAALDYLCAPRLAGGVQGGAAWTWLAGVFDGDLPPGLTVIDRRADAAPAIPRRDGGVIELRNPTRDSGRFELEYRVPPIETMWGGIPVGLVGLSATHD